MKKLCTVFLIILMICSATIPGFAITKTPELIGETAILIDATTGKVLFEKNSNKQMYPASTTKIMTALLALENLDKNQVVTIDSEIPFTEGSRIYLLEGETITVDQLLHAMMTESANDCAIALGKEISGTVPEFAKLMNQRAKELGAKNTNFVNPNGLHEAEHMSTAYDLAQIARYAMNNEKTGKEFRELVTTYKYYIPATNKQKERFLYNTNRLLYDTKTKVMVNGVLRDCKYEGVTGIKTGYTGQAQGCLVASAKKNGTELLSVVMKSTDDGRFADSITMLDWGFANYKTVAGMKAGKDLGQMKIKRGSVNRVGVVLGKSIATTLPIEASEDILTTKVVLDQSVKAPVEKGQKVGKIEVYESGELLTEYDAVTTAAVPKGGVFSIFGIADSTAKKIGWTIVGILLLLIVLLVAYVIWKRRQIRFRKAKREERRKRIAEAEARKKASWENQYEDRYQGRYK